MKITIKTELCNSHPWAVKNRILSYEWKGESFYGPLKGGGADDHIECEAQFLKERLTLYFRRENTNKEKQRE